MADYYVVPKSALDATADAIKSKTGSSEEIEFTGDGFKDAVDAIPTGGGDVAMQYAHGLNYMFYIPYGTTYTFPFEELTINAPLAYRFSNFFSCGAFSSASQAKRGVKKITLNVSDFSEGNNVISTAFNGIKDLEEVEINTDSGVSTPIVGVFSYLPALKKISGIKFNASAINWTYDTVNGVIYFPTGSVLEEIRFVQDSMTYAGTYRFGRHPNLSEESLVSIANAMNASNTTHTIELHEAASAKLPSIYGTVSNGSFTLDTQGSVSLADFITNIKGWTVA